MTARKRVFVGLSGGVDSAVSAALLKQRGYDVTGVFARIVLEGYPCTAGDDRRDALRVAAHLQIPFEEIDLSKAYHEKVFANALESYRRGETPNPDALCNREIKFGLLYDFARSKGAEYVATGHYARTTKTASGRTHLLAGDDPQKDQSYFLWAVPEEKLANTLFPVGELHKPQVRALAREYGLPNAERKDSQGLCFLGDISIEDALAKELKLVPGDMLDEKGVIVGRHRGAILYTIGQRHGFEMNTQSADQEPRYVIAKDMEKNTITVSKNPAPEAHESSHATEVTLRETNWIGTVADGKYMARFRYRQTLRPVKLTRVGNSTNVRFNSPQAIPVGQSLVLYDGDRCLGGGIIDTVR